MSIESITDEDVIDLITCGHVGRYLFKWSKLFYALKDKILLLYAVPDGVDLQVWRDADFYYEEEWHAEHKHILARYLLRGHLFHIPTNDFYYFNFEYQNDKYSPGFFEKASDYKQLIEGRKEYSYNKESRDMAWSALKRLVKRHGYLLKDIDALPLFASEAQA